MGLLHIEGNDAATTLAAMTTYHQRRYGHALTHAGCDVVAGRFGGYAFQLTDDKLFQLPISVNEFWFGGAFRYSGRPGTTRILNVASPGVLEGAVQIITGGRLRVVRSANTELAGTAFNVVRPSVWHWIEVYHKWADAGGRWTVKLDGQTLIDFTGDTKHSAAAALAVIDINSSSVFQYVQWDDIYVSDTGFLDPLRVVRLDPNSDDTSEFSTVGVGAGHFQFVDEAGCDDDVTALESGTVGQREVFGYSDLPETPGTVHAVDVVTEARLTDATAHSLKHVVKSGAADDEDAGTALSGTAYDVLTRRLTTDPATGAAWTGTGINAAKFGVEVA